MALVKRLAKVHSIVGRIALRAAKLDAKRRVVFAERIGRGSGEECCAEGRLRLGQSRSYDGESSIPIETKAASLRMSEKSLAVK
jgi:hypothetical protein